jgi:signal transduction histidine kinase
MLTNLINDLLDLAKINTLNFKFNNDYFDLNILIQQSLDTMKYMASQKQVSLIYENDIQVEKQEVME